MLPNETKLVSISAFNTKMLWFLEQIHDKYPATHDVQLHMDSNIDLFQINSSSLHHQYLNMLLGVGHLPLITIPTQTEDVTQCDRRSVTKHMLIDHITSTNPVPLPQVKSLSDHDLTFSVQELSHNEKVPKSEVYTKKISEAKTKTFCELLAAADWSQLIATALPDIVFLQHHLTIEECYNEAFP